MTSYSLKGKAIGDGIMEGWSVIVAANLWTRVRLSSLVHTSPLWAIPWHGLQRVWTESLYSIQSWFSFGISTVHISKHIVHLDNLCHLLLTLRANYKSSIYMFEGVGIILISLTFILVYCSLKIIIANLWTSEIIQSNSYQPFLRILCHSTGFTFWDNTNQSFRTKLVYTVLS